jgi:group I intron endonuclease
VFEVYQKVDNVNDLINFEQKAIDLLNPFYNINKIANSSLGIKRSDETKNKISISLKGKEGRNKGYKYSDEYKKRMSDIRKGVPVPKRKGIKLTEEHKQKLSLSKLGKKKEKGILYGENAVRSKLNTEQVIEIRRKYNEDNISTVKLGKEYCVSSHSISCIINYKTWKHI